MLTLVLARHILMPWPDAGTKWHRAGQMLQLFVTTGAAERWRERRKRPKKNKHRTVGLTSSLESEVPQGSKGNEGEERDGASQGSTRVA